MKYVIALLTICTLALQAPLVQAQSVKSLSSQVKKLSSRIARLESRASVAGPQGVSGPQGIQGPQGAQGPQGPAGPSALAPIPSGQVVYGVMGGNFEGTFLELYASLPAPAPAPLTDAAIIIKSNPILIASCGTVGCLSANEQSNQSLCKGTSTFPNPDPGILCVYPTSMFTATSIETQSMDAVGIASDDSSRSKYGFKVQLSTAGSGINFFEAVWAYRAP